MRRPGLLRVAAGKGAEIAVEIWCMPPDGFGRFVAAVPSPLSIGSVQLADGRTVKGFLVEAEAVSGARDISAFGGWRAFVAAAGWLGRFALGRQRLVARAHMRRDQAPAFRDAHPGL